jgi:hypothetical protein
MKGSRADLHIKGLQDHATVITPKFLQALYQTLKGF